MTNKKTRYIIFVIISLTYIIIDKFIILNNYGWLELIPFEICVVLLVIGCIQLLGSLKALKIKMILSIICVLIIIWFVMLSADYKGHRNLNDPFFNLAGYEIVQDYDMDLKTGREYKSKSTFYLFGLKISEVYAVKDEM